jgi:hypothetical protein
MDPAYVKAVALHAAVEAGEEEIQSRTHANFVTKS